MVNWLNRSFDLKVQLANFVATRRAGEGSRSISVFLKGRGSFSFSFRFSFDDGGPDAIIRFPKPGHTATLIGTKRLQTRSRSWKS